MAETIDDSETFTIELTENGEPEPTARPWALVGGALIALYLLVRRK